MDERGRRVGEAQSARRWPGVAGQDRREGPPRPFDVILSALVVLVVCVPTMAVEEDWHGHPMIDEPSHLWIVFACIAAASFMVGGALVGIRRPARAAVDATASSVLALLVLVAADVCRRLLVVHDGLPMAVVRLWIVGILTGLVLSATGSVLGRRLAGDTR